MIIPTIPVANYVQILVAGALASKFEAYAPVSADSGGETWFDGNGVFYCPDAGTWSQVWDAHIKNESIGNVTVRNINPAPPVNFEKNVVVALFSGPMRGVVGYRVASGFQLGQDAVVRLAPVLSTSSTANVAIPRPWAFIILKRSSGTVNVQIPNGNGWQTVAKVKPNLPESN